MGKLGKIEFYDWIILSLTIAAVFSFLKSSSFLIITDVLNSELLMRFSVGNDTINNLSIGWIVSAIFYLLNVFIPKRVKLKQYKKIINDDLKYIESAYCKISKCLFDCDDIEKTILEHNVDDLYSVAYYEKFEYRAEGLGPIKDYRYKYKCLNKSTQ